MQSSSLLFSRLNESKAKFDTDKNIENFQKDLEKFLNDEISYIRDLLSQAKLSAIDSVLSELPRNEYQEKSCLEGLYGLMTELSSGSYSRSVDELISDILENISYIRGTIDNSPKLIVQGELELFQKNLELCQIDLIKIGLLKFLASKTDYEELANLVNQIIFLSNSPTVADLNALIEGIERVISNGPVSSEIAKQLKAYKLHVSGVIARIEFRIEKFESQDHYFTIFNALNKTVQSLVKSDIYEPKAIYEANDNSETAEKKRQVNLPIAEFLLIRLIDLSHTPGKLNNKDKKVIWERLGYGAFSGDSFFIRVVDVIKQGLLNILFGIGVKDDASGAVLFKQVTLLDANSTAGNLHGTILAIKNFISEETFSEEIITKLTAYEESLGQIRIMKLRSEDRFFEIYNQLGKKVKDLPEIKQIIFEDYQVNDTAEMVEKKRNANALLVDGLLLKLMNLSRISNQLGEVDRNTIQQILIQQLLKSEVLDDNSFINKVATNIKKDLLEILDNLSGNQDDKDNLLLKLNSFNPDSTEDATIISYIEYVVEENKDKAICAKLNAYKLSLSEIIKRNEFKKQAFLSKDPFFVIFKDLTNEVKETLPEIAELEFELYEANDDLIAGVISKKMEWNRHQSVRLKLILMHSLQTSKLKGNAREVVEKILSAARLRDDYDRLNKVEDKELRHNSPCAYHYQQLYYLLKDVPLSGVQSIFKSLNDILYPDVEEIMAKPRQTEQDLLLLTYAKLTEQEKIPYFYNEVLKAYIKARKDHGVFGDRSLGNALEKFIKDPAYLDLMQKYTFKVPHVVGEKDEVPNVFTAGKRPERVALVRIEDVLVFRDGGINKELIAKLKSEYNRVVLFKQPDTKSEMYKSAYEDLAKELAVEIVVDEPPALDLNLGSDVEVEVNFPKFPASYINSYLDASHLKFSVFQKNNEGKDEVRYLPLDINFYTVTQEKMGNKCRWVDHQIKNENISNTKQSDDYQELDALLEIYVQTRKVEAERSESNYNSFFSRFFGMSAEVKIAAAEKLIRDIVREKQGKTSQETFTNDDIVALRSDRLGKLLAKFDYKLLPESFRRSEIQRKFAIGKGRL